jgi:molybdopterin-binding protein
LYGLDQAHTLPFMPRYRLSRAAGLVGVSDDTVRRWVDLGRLSASTDEHGHRVIEGADLAAFLASQAGTSATAADREYRVSTRNSFPGLVTRIQLGAVAAQVDVQAGPHRIVSLITREAVEEMQLEVGDEVVAAVKATNVTVERP